MIFTPRPPVTGDKSYDEQEGWVSETYPEGPDAQTPMATENPDFPNNLEPRGRTRVWENISTS